VSIIAKTDNPFADAGISCEQSSSIILTTTIRLAHHYHHENYSTKVITLFAEQKGPRKQNINTIHTIITIKVKRYSADIQIKLNKKQYRLEKIKISHIEIV